uniref:alkaline phosphatase-like isoform X1 n=1 Tax=Myxine glutinosa TaxID=7769 RepID=UPI00358EF87B
MRARRGGTGKQRTNNKPSGRGIRAKDQRSRACEQTIRLYNCYLDRWTSSLNKRNTSKMFACFLTLICLLGEIPCAKPYVPGTVPAEELNAQFWYKIAKEDLKQVKDLTPIVKKAKNVILFLGDGMGLPTVTAARILKGQQIGKPGEETKLAMDRYPYVALSKTYNTNAQVSDSAGTATAFLCGAKTNSGTLGVTANVTRGDYKASLYPGNRLESIVKWAEDMEKSTAVITTTRVTHATPGASYAHSADRDWMSDAEMPEDARSFSKDIAQQLLENIPNIETASYVWNRTALEDIDAKTTDFLLGLFEPGDMQFEQERNTTSDPSLLDMVKKALEILKKNTNGYFMLVEGGRIDHGHHDGCAHKALTEAVAFDDVVGTITNMVNKDDTLLVVTADHSHTFSLGGYALRGNPIFEFAKDLSDEDNLTYTSILYGNGPGYQANRTNLTTEEVVDKNYLQRASVPLKSETHGGEDVAIYAQGPMAHFFQGVKEQNYIAHLMSYAACMKSPVDYSTESHCNAAPPLVTSPFLFSSLFAASGLLGLWLCAGTLG